MKKYTKFLIALVVLMSLVVCFTACNRGQITKLSMPKNLSVAGNTLSWDEVENAQSYEIILNSSNPIVTKNNYYDLGITQIGSYEVKVRAKAVDSKRGTIYSEYAEYKFLKTNKLAAPILKIEEKILSWEAVANASSYTIKILDKSSKELYKETVSELQFNLDESDKEEKLYSAIGSYTISVIANPSETDDKYATSDAAQIKYYISEVLPTPQISGVSSTSVRWTAIANINSYTLDLYYDVEGTSIDEKVAEYTTTSNTYAISSFDFTKNGVRRPGTYYCVVRANGDGNVYISSSYCSRNSEYDLLVLDTWDTSSISYSNDNILSWSVDSIDNYKSFTILLKATNSTSSSSLDTIEKVVYVDDASKVATYKEATQFIPGKTYYIQTEPGVYVKAHGETSYILVNKGITSFDSSIEYYVLEDENFIKAESGYKKVTSEFKAGTIYFAKVGVEYVEQGRYTYIGNLEKATAMDPATVFFKRNTDGTYTSIGNTASSSFDNTLEAYYVENDFNGFIEDVEYYTYYKFDKFENDVEYYTQEYAPLAGFEQGTTYYEIASVSYSYDINNFFFTYNGGEYVFLKSDDNYYGKLFNITLSLDGNKNTVITSDAVTLEEQYLSFKKPKTINSSISYNETTLKGYFENENEYTTFVNKYNGYYYVETLGELRFITKEPNANYVLLADLDAKSYNWVTIDNFNGILDGNNHSIKNIAFYAKHSETSQDIGFIGHNNGVIKNLFFIEASSNFAVTEGVFGGVAAVNNNEISNCYISGSVDGLTVAGGIVGINNGVVKNSQASCKVTSQVAGGLVAVNKGSIIGCGTTNITTATTLYKEIGKYEDLNDIGDDVEIYVVVENVYISLGTKANGEISNAYDKYYFAYMPENKIVGGLVAKNESGANISKSYAINNVKAEGDNSIAGGLVGINDGTISSSYVGLKYSNNASLRSTVIANGNNTIAGGFVGKNTGNITTASSTSRAAAGLYIGGFVGLNEGHIEKSYSTGGTEVQTVQDRGAFTGKNTGSISYCYFYNHFTNQTYNNEDSAAERKMSLNDITIALTSYGFASLENYLEPVVIGVIYAESYEDTKMSGALVLINSNIMIDSDTVINLTSDVENAPYFWVGDNSRKGNVLYVITYEDMMVVFNITIK